MTKGKNRQGKMMYLSKYMAIYQNSQLHKNVIIFNIMSSLSVYREDTSELIVTITFINIKELFRVNLIWRASKEKQLYHLMEKKIDIAKYDPNNGIGDF